MNRDRRAARACLTGAGLALTASLAAACTSHPVLAAVGIYLAAVAAWCGRSLHACHRRTLAEADWERRLVLGEHPAPLDPCCELAEHTGGTAHDPWRCTDLTRHTLTAPTWKDDRP
ncbi:hypothetical protein [Streptomyces spiralis]